MAHIQAPTRARTARAKELAEFEDDELSEVAHAGGEDAELAEELLEGRKLAASKQEGSAPVDPEAITVDGTVQLELFEAGGKRPSRASIKFTGGKVSLVAGRAFHKGERLAFSGTAVVNAVGQVDEHDPKTGQVTDCEQRHEARIVDLQVSAAG